MFLGELWSYHGSSFFGTLANDSTSDPNSAKYGAISRVMELLCLDVRCDKVLSENINPISKRASDKPKSFEVQNKFIKKDNTMDVTGTNVTSGFDKENTDALNIQSHDLVIVDTTVTQTKKKAGRKPKNRLKKDVTKPIVKKEVIQRKHRAETNYTLRKNIKKVKFMDEVSEPSDIEDENDTGQLEDLSSMSESDEYKPDVEIEEDDHEMDISDDDEISEEENDKDENIVTKDNDCESEEEDLFSIDHIDVDDETEFINPDDSIGIKESENITSQDATEVSTESMTMFTVKVCPDGTVEVLNQEDASKPLDPGYETAIALVGPAKSEQSKIEHKEIDEKGANVKSIIKLNQKRKLADDLGNVIGFGRVVQITEQQQQLNSGDNSKKEIDLTEKIINPRSLLKAKSTSTSDTNQAQDKTSIDTMQQETKAIQYTTTSSNSHHERPEKDIKSTPLVLFCSLCNFQCGGDGKLGGQQAMRHHAACKHPKSRFFVLPVGNPHRECAQCNVLMSSYENTIANDANIGLKGMVLPRCE